MVVLSHQSEWRVNIRNYYDVKGDGNRVPTKIGVALSLRAFQRLHHVAEFVSEDLQEIGDELAVLSERQHQEDRELEEWRTRIRARREAAEWVTIDMETGRLSVYTQLPYFVTFRFTWYVSVILPWYDYLSSVFVLNFEIITFVIFQLWPGLYLAARCYSQPNVGHLWAMTWVHIWPHFLCISSLALVWHSFCWWLDPEWFCRPVPSLSCLQNAGLCVRAIFPFRVSLWSRVHSFFACRSATDFLMYIIYSYIYIHISTIYLYRELTLETSFWDVRRTSARLYIKWYFLCQITVIVYLDYLYDFSMLYSLTDCPMHPSGTLHTAMWDCLWTVFYPTCSFPYQWHALVRLVFFLADENSWPLFYRLMLLAAIKKWASRLFSVKDSLW